MSYTDIIIIAFAVFGSAVIKNGVGVGAGIFLLPFLALVLPAKVALGLGAPAMLISDIIGVRNYWGEWDKKELLILMPFAALGVLLGSYLVVITPDTVFKHGVGVFALLFASHQIVKTIRIRYFNPAETKTGTSIERMQSRAYTVLFGFLGGIASTVAHAGGLMMSVYMLQKRSNPRTFVGTLVLFFALINLFKIFAYSGIGIITDQVLILVLAFSPIIIIGGVLGNALNKRVSQELFRLIVLTLIFLIGLRLLWLA
ncbi:sulfite exporter TauE/SafE family protein [Desulfosediminicola sp.]|uniref:sulfite exporter TauE/SafE family protein n=1 Tax=Desulfosediminicola sp. TaxID=2886825 RepID=UPI003AF23FD4